MLTRLQEEFKNQYLYNPNTIGNGMQSMHAARKAMCLKPISDNSAAVVACRMLSNVNVITCMDTERDNRVVKAVKDANHYANELYGVAQEARKAHQYGPSSNSYVASAKMAGVYREGMDLSSGDGLNIIVTREGEQCDK